MDHVGDTAGDNASSTKPKTLVDYFEDARFRTGDKCRVGRSNSSKHQTPPEECLGFDSCYRSGAGGSGAAVGD